MRDRAYLPGGVRPASISSPVDVPPKRPAAPLAVLVVGYRRFDLLERCLASVREHLPGVRMLVWDNTAVVSSERDVLVAANPDVEWELSAVNAGFAAAVNQLAERAPGYDLLLLNPDAVLAGSLPAARAALAEPDVAAVSGRIVEADTVVSPVLDAPSGTTSRRAARGWDVAHREPTLSRALVAHAGYAPALRGRRTSDLYAAPPEEVSGYLTGACLLVSRRAWDAVGPFDEEFFLYGEEADWQLRARASGWRLVLVDEVAAHHRGHGTVSDDPTAAQRSTDLLRAHVALTLEHHAGLQRADAFLAGASVLDRVQRSHRRARRARWARRPSTAARPAVVLTINRLVFGGAERHHVQLAGELCRRGYDVTIACVQRLGPLVREVDPQVRVVRQPWWAPALDLPPGQAVIISGDTNTETGFATLWRRAGRGRRWLAAAHLPPDPQAPTYGRLLAGAMRAADGFVALSPRHWDEVSAHQRVARRHFIAPNGVQPDSVAPAQVRNRPRDPARPLQLVMLSRIVEHKNPQVLIEALAGLAGLADAGAGADAAVQDWELSIFGDGPDRARLEAATPASVRDRVHWRGWSPGPDDALADCDLLCVPSRSEAFPLVILEAMARAVPVLASPVCSVPDMLDHGRAGLLAERPDVAAWRAALEPVLRDPGGLPALGLAGLARMRGLYTLDAMADAYEHAIHSVVTGSDSGGTDGAPDTNGLG